MSEQSTTPDLVELTRRGFEAMSRRDIDGMLSVWGRDPVWDASPMGLGVYGGLDAIRRFFEDWVGSFEEFEIEPKDIRDLGNGVGLAVVRLQARPVGSKGHVQWRYAAVSIVADGEVLRTTNYTDIDEARAAAERLAEERAQADV